MPDTRQHRGAHPEDVRLFHAKQIPTLRAATGELSWLLTHGYAMTSALKLVGDRHSLNKRQRIALSRAVCSDQHRIEREAKRLNMQQITDEDLIIDGFNLLITIEAALGGGVILICRDGCYRDISSVHGTYRTVQETSQALALIGNALAALQPKSAHWLFDKPISNSGRLAQQVLAHAIENDWPWSTDVIFNPDTAIIASKKIAVSSDSSVLNGVSCWVNLSSYLIAKHLPNSWFIDLS